MAGVCWDEQAVAALQGVARALLPQSHGAFKNEVEGVAEVALFADTFSLSKSKQGHLAMVAP